jgi:hypothetical protein
MPLPLEDGNGARETFMRGEKLKRLGTSAAMCAWSMAGLIQRAVGFERVYSGWCRPSFIDFFF